MRQPDTIEGFVRCVAADRDCTIGGVYRYAHGVVVDPQTISTLVVHGDKSISGSSDPPRGVVRDGAATTADTVGALASARCAMPGQSFLAGQW